MKIIRQCVGAMQVNCYILCQSGHAVVIDPGADAVWILNHLQEQNVVLDAILLTHGHFDHIGALDELREKTGAKAGIHVLDEDMLGDPKANLSAYMSAPVSVKPADFVLRDGDVLTYHELELRVLHTPGHSPGGVCFVCGDALFTGDTLFQLSVGRSDFPSSDPAALDHSVREVISKLKGDYTVYPGHGPQSTLAFEKENNPYL